jgi:DNA-binding transcriptional ArsR family regulator
VDRLSLFKVLADSSRYAIYQEVAAAAEPLSTVEIAERLDLHPNTVRLHLEKMRDAGLLDAFSDRHGAVGRPQHRWSVGSHARRWGWSPPASGSWPTSWPRWLSNPRLTLANPQVTPGGRLRWGAAAGSNAPLSTVKGQNGVRRERRRYVSGRSWPSWSTWASIPLSTMAQRSKTQT